MKLYLSGPMTGIRGHNRKAFNKAAIQLRKAGYKVINPAEMDHNLTKPLPWTKCLKKDIVQLLKCDALAMLPGWRDSRGANLEAYIARQLSMEVRPVSYFLTNMEEYV